MIAEHDKSIIKYISEKYHAKRVLLFGSSIDSSKESNDIDIAVEGILPVDFYAYYGELMFALSKPVDIIDLAGESKFKKLVRMEGELLYG